MLRSSNNRTTFEQNFSAKLGATTQARIIGASVSMQLSGFLCSGVILYFNETSQLTYILTAKHNLLLGKPFSPSKKPQPSDQIDAFTAGVTVYYAAPGLNQKPVKAARVDSSANNGGNPNLFPKQDAGSWAVDLMLLQSPDGGIYEFAQTSAVLLSQTDASDTWSNLFGAALKRTKQNAYIQTGFGYSNDQQLVNDQLLGKFQVRYTLPCAATVTDEVYNYDEASGVDDTYQKVVMFDADDSNSTAPGDSGGPLFMVDNAIDPTKRPNVTLLGITLGSNQSLTARTEVKEPPVVNNTVTYLKDFIAQIFQLE